MSSTALLKTIDHNGEIEGALSRFRQSARDLAHHALDVDPVPEGLDAQVSQWYETVTNLPWSNGSNLPGETTDQPQTELAAVLPDQPWRSYSFGDSVDAITGQHAVRALMPFTLTHNGPYVFKLNSSEVSNEQSFNQVFSAEVSGSYNADFQVSASSSFLSNITYSSNSYTIIVSADLLSTGTGVPEPAISLTPVALQLATESPDEFRETFGDYMVAGATMGSRLLVTYRFHASSSEKLIDFQAKVSGGTAFFSASGSTALKQASSQCNVSIEMNMYLEGIKGEAPPTSTDPSDIPKILDWFLEQNEAKEYLHLDPIPRRARLEHHSNLAMQLPRIIDVDPERFASIKALNFRIEQFASILNNLPVYFSNQDSPTPDRTNGELVTHLRSQFAASGPMLPYRQDLIDEMERQADAAIKALEPAVALVTLYENLRNNPPFEGDNASVTASFGYLPGSGIPVEIKSSINHKKERYDFAQRVKYTFQWPWQGVGTDHIVSGWQIEALNGNHPGHWRRRTPLIGRSNGQIYIESGVTRDLNFRLTVYYIPLTEFPWLQASNEQEENALS